MINDAAVARFWNKVAISGPDECWLWKGGGRPNGYGRLKIAGRIRSTHRIAYELAHGVVPQKDMVVMHTCDIRRCVNPRHLKLGTTLDNVRDRDEKGRLSRGEAHYKTKLTGSDIEDIRTRRFNGVARPVLAKEYGLSVTSITRITNGESWKHVSNPHPSRPTYGSGNPGAKLTETLIPMIRARGKDGASHPTIAQEFGVDPETIRRILIGERWRHVG